MSDKLLDSLPMKQVRDDDDGAVEIHRGVAVRDAAVDSIVADGFDVEIRRPKIQQLMKMTEMVKRSNVVVVVVDGLETSMMTMYYVGQLTSHEPIPYSSRMKKRNCR